MTKVLGKAEKNSTEDKGDDKMDKGTQRIEGVDDFAFARETKIKKSKADKTIKNLFKNRTKLRFDLAIQRNEVWSLEQKSNLIHSILYGFPIPPVMVQETDDEFTWFLDGKQRLTAIIGYINGDWALSKNTQKVYGFQIAGHKFKDLLEDMQEAIYDEQVSLIMLKNMTDEERDEMFVRWNSGSVLSKIELTRAMHSELISQINHISELEFFADDIALTGKARNRFVDQEVIFQIAMLLDEGKDKIKGFGSKQITDYVLRLKESKQVLSDQLIKKFETISHYLNMAVSEFNYEERKKALKKLNVPMVFFTAIIAIDKNMKQKLFGDFIRSFLISNYSIESNYGQACQSGSSKKENVLIRLKEMEFALEDFMKIVKETGLTEVNNSKDKKDIKKAIKIEDEGKIELVKP